MATRLILLVVILNTNNKNKFYSNLINHIKKTYSNPKFKIQNFSNNSYIQAIKWATLRLKNEAEGIICFVTPNGFINSKSCNGMRQSLSAEHSSIYILDCKGDGNKSIAGYADQRGGIFTGVKTGVSITFLVKNTNAIKQGQIYYYTFDQPNKQKEKIAKIKNWASLVTIENQMLLTTINEQNNWIKQDKTLFFNEQYFMPLRKEKRSYQSNLVIFDYSTNGVSTNRNTWCWNFSKVKLATNMQKTIAFYNDQRIKFHNQAKIKNIKFFAGNDHQKIKWSRDLYKYAKYNQLIKYRSENIIPALYRPFSQTFVYYDKYLNEQRNQLPTFFCQLTKTTGLVISYTNPHNSLSVLATNQIFHLHYINNSLFFPLSFHQVNESGLIDKIKIDGVSDHASAIFCYKENRILQKLEYLTISMAYCTAKTT